MKNTVNIEVKTKEQRDQLISKLQAMEFEKQYPKSIEYIVDRSWFVSDCGNIERSDYCIDRKNVSTRKRAEQLLKLSQLLELRDAWNNIDGGVDFEFGETNYCFTNEDNIIIREINIYYNAIFHFRKQSTRDLFLKTFKEDLEFIKELM